ncbi:MAG: hypothetical protein AAF959_01055 [Cyanobacteria bacterium P01_D01_bin.56]
MQTELLLSSPPIADLPFHAWDFIYAKHPDPDERPEWYTEKRYPLSGALVEQGSYLYGVRFDATTTYAMLDIDKDSAFHPNKDPYAVRQLCEALEPVGLVRSLICQSSSSGGIHIYFPWDGEAIESYRIGLIFSVLLERKGFKASPGHLEIFPNPKPYRGKEIPSLYNAHRLPLQRGFYLLNEDFQPQYTTKERFITCWRSTAAGNTINTAIKNQLLKQYQRRQYPVSTSAEKFLNDLNAAIEPGWERTDDHPPFLWEGQEVIPKTNQILGRIATREYVFFHIDGRHPPLEGDPLIDRIVEVATHLPGYKEYCRHQHEIRKRAAEWARCVENSHYFHYGIKKKPQSAPVEVNWHQQKALASRSKVTAAIAELLEQGKLPSSATARAKILVEICKTSMTTLYKNKDLWHPSHLLIEAKEEKNRFLESKFGFIRPNGAKNPNYKNLLEGLSCNTLQTQIGQGIPHQNSESNKTASCNPNDLESAVPALSPDIATSQQNCAEESVSETIQRVKEWLELQKKQRGAQTKDQTIDVEVQLSAEHEQQHQAQLQEWLATGDPILMQEALQYGSVLDE